TVGQWESYSHTVDCMKLWFKFHELLPNEVIPDSEAETEKKVDAAKIAIKEKKAAADVAEKSGKPNPLQYQASSAGRRTSTGQQQRPDLAMFLDRTAFNRQSNKVLASVRSAASSFEMPKFSWSNIPKGIPMKPKMMIPA
ncbi:MAG: hypothetical protein M1823_006227, partial [Watsoniomyces obsoletus]